MLKIELEQTGATLCGRALQRGAEVGRAEAEICGDTIRYRSGWLGDPEDYGLLDGLVRAVFDAARTAGVTYYDIPDEAAGEYRRALCTGPGRGVGAILCPAQLQGAEQRFLAGFPAW